MPELPDVETFKRYLDRTVLHQTVASVHLNGAGRMLAGVSKSSLGRQLEGNGLEEIRRHGKHLFVRAGNAGWLALHFGMTGKLDYYKDMPEDLNPDHVRLRLDLKNNYHLAFVCPRKFGKIGFTSDVETFIADNNLGPDADAISEQDFSAMLKQHGGGIKSLLMNQQYIAGLGNIYVDEILFQAGIHPEKPVDQLSGQERETLYRQMHRVLEKAVEAKADPGKMPDDWLLPHRENGVDCPRGKGKIKKIRVNSRSTYYCPGCQKK